MRIQLVPVDNRRDANRARKNVDILFNDAHFHEMMRRSTAEEPGYAM